MCTIFLRRTNFVTQVLPEVRGRCCELKGRLRIDAIITFQHAEFCFTSSCGVRVESQAISSWVSCKTYTLLENWVERFGYGMFLSCALLRTTTGHNFPHMTTDGRILPRARHIYSHDARVELFANEFPLLQLQNDSSLSGMGSWQYANCTIPFQLHRKICSSLFACQWSRLFDDLHPI